MVSASWRIPALRPSTYATPAELSVRRTRLESLDRPPTDPSVKVDRVEWNGVPCLVCAPPESTGVVMHLHGGGFRLGSAEQFLPFATTVAANAQATVVVVDYRLSPEHPFPAALHDAAAAYEHLLQAGHDTVVLLGDSAGGGLAAALVVASAQSRLGSPSGLVLLSPWLDLRCVASSFTSRADLDQYFSLSSARDAAEMYLQGHDATDPLVSPGTAQLASWPPSLVFAGTDEVLLDDGMAFVMRLAESRTDVSARFVPRVPHVWPTLSPQSDESAQVFDAIAAFVSRLAHG